MAVNLTPKNRFSDLDLSFARNPISHDINILTDEASVKRSLRNLILSNTYDRPFQPELNGNVTAHLFEPMTELTEIRIEKGIRDAISSYEKRVIVQDVVVRGDKDLNSFDITIQFQIRNSQQVSEVQFYLERLR